MSEPPRSEFERLRQAVAERIELALGVEQQSQDTPSEAVGTGEARRSLVQGLSATLDRWSRGAPLRRLLGGIEHDVLTSPGEWVALEAELGLPGRLGGCARFMLAGELVAEVPIVPGRRLCAMIRAPEPGLYRARVELDNKARQLIGQAMVQVAGSRPLIFIDAGLLLPSEGGPPPRAARLSQLVRALAQADFEFAYFDLDASTRDATIRSALAEAKLPQGVVISYATHSDAVESLGLDLGEMFGVAAIQRFHAKGVPICAIVTERFDALLSRPEGVSVLHVEEAHTRLREDGLAPERERSEAFIAARAATDPAIWRLDRSTGSRLRPGNQIVAELDNRAARERLFELIETARVCIHLQVYIIRASEFAEELTVRLIRRARAGVRVRMMVDALYSDQEVLGRQNPVMLSLEAEPGIEIVALSPIETRADIDLDRLKRRDHRKLLIVDGERAIVSGRNASDEYYRGFDEVAIHDHTNHTRIPWLDAHLELAGPIVADVQACFAKTWAGGGGAALEDSDSAPDSVPQDPPFPGSSAARFVVHEGLRDAHGLAMYEGLLELAERHVYIVNDFPIVSTLERAITRLLARGVRVTLLTGNAAARRADGSLFPAPIYRTLFEHMVKDRLESLLLAGVELYEFCTPPSPSIVARGGRVRPYVHAKLMSVDGRLCTIGSANLDATASFWESEANVVVHDEGFTTALEEQLRELIAGSVEIDASSDYWQRERVQRAVVGKLWPGSIYS